MFNEQKTTNIIMEAKERFPEIAHYFDVKDVRDVIKHRELDIVRNIYHKLELWDYLLQKEDLPDLPSDSCDQDQDQDQYEDEDEDEDEE